MQLEFIIQGQTLLRIDTEKPVENSRGYLKAHFALPVEYNGTISAYFKRLQDNVWVGSPVTVDKATGQCDVPDDIIVAGDIYVGLISTDTDIDIPTNAVAIPIGASGVPSTLLPNPDGTVNQYMDFVAKYNEVKEDAAATAQSASEASTSATNAHTSEVNAKASETAAKSSEDKAKLSETASKTSETNAKTSETNAKTSETNSKTSETEAKAARDAAVATITGKIGIDDAVTSSTKGWSSSKVASELAHIATEFDVAVGAITVDSEVILSRGGKTTLGDRLDESDSKLNAMTIKLTNLITNGNAANGTTGWFGAAATIGVSNGKFTVLATGLGGGLAQSGKSLIKGHKYYLQAKITATSPTKARLYLEIASSPYTQYGFVEHDGSGAEKIVSMIVTAPDTISNGVVRIKDVSSSGWTQFTADDILMVDLSADLGDGNEPNVTKMNEMMSQFTNSWFEGSQYASKTIKDLILSSARQVNSLFVNVKEYGAKGDGATDDTVAISLALSILPINGTLFFPIGTYIVNNILLKSNMIIQGSGFGSIIKLKSSAVAPANCLTINTITNVTIKDIQLDGNRLNNQTTGDSLDQNFNGMWVRNSSDIRIENVWSHSNGYHGCIMVGSTRIVITKSKFTDNGYRPFHGHGTVTDSEFSFNYCSDNGKGFAGQAGGAYDGIFFFNDIKNVLINGNRVITSNNIGCIIVGGKLVDLVGSEQVSVTNNILESKDTAEAAGVVLLGTDLKNIVVSNNTIYNCLYGIHGGDGFDSIGESIVISNNTINACKIGMLLMHKIARSTITGNVIRLCSEGGIYATDLVDSVISNNSISDNGNQTPTQDAINLTSCLRNIISNNIFNNTSNVTYQKYGVHENTGCNSNLIIGNQFYNMVTAATLLIGANSVAKGNMINGVYTA